MEIDVTEIVQGMVVDTPRFISGSFLGTWPDPDTRAQDAWGAALSFASKHPVLNHREDIAAMRAHLLGYGAWEGEEIANMTAIELTALLVQLIAGDMHEGGLHAASTEGDWAEYEVDGIAGRVPWNLSRGDDGRFYYDLN
jgi:hypothetical protein